MLSRCTVSATLPCDGLKAADTFYSKKLGLRRTAGSVKHGFLEFAAGGGSVIQLFESDSKKSDDTCATFVVKSLAAEMKALRKKGVKFEEYDLPGIKTVNGLAEMGKHRAAWIKDPGGNVLGLYEAGKPAESTKSK